MTENKKIQSFSEELYQNLSRNDLILYTIYSLEKENIERIFPNIVVRCFELFPKKFHLQGYPHYPDSVLPDRPLRKISEISNPHRYLDGGSTTGYEITKWGWERLDKLKDVLELGKKDQDIIDKKITSWRYKIAPIVNQIEKHSLYYQYSRSSENMDVPETLLRDLLYSTMETSEEKLRENMSILLGYCETLEREDIKEFLEFCSSKHRKIFN